MAKIEMNMSVEAVLYDAIKGVLQQLYDEHGLKVTNIGAYWLDYMGSPSVLSEVKITTVKK